MGLGLDSLNGSVDMSGETPGGISPASLMTMLNDGSFDMNALFHGDSMGLAPPTATMSNLPSRQQTQQDGSSSNAFRSGGFQSVNSMIGIAATP